ncbi:ATP-binding cassette domain-containing protein [Streptomyces sp. NPDC051976]|uniref:ABC transporter ATP-binding protein n=1 Tax=Streptomyces sp. NPDC051976 TaxID=3154947 RepID=UPI00343AAE16
MSAQVLNVEGLHAGYRGVEVLRDISFSVAEGEVVALLGPNGAGKTTSLLTFAGVIRPSRGAVRVLGFPSERQSTHLLAQRGMVFVPEDRGLFGQLSVADTLRLAQRSRVRETDEVMDLLPALRPLWRRKVALLSGGEQQMVALAAALVRRPRLLLLDEMSLGLAPQVVSELLAAVRRMADQDGTGVLLVEQHARVALAASDRAIVLRHGEVALEGCAEDVSSQLHVVESSYLGESGNLA